MADAVGIIKRVYKAGDFVVVKLDIDTPELEDNIMAGLLSIRSNVAEVFFQNHFDAPEMQQYFGKTGVTYNDTLSFFHTYRSAGMRLHYWP